MLGVILGQNSPNCPHFCTIVDLFLELSITISTLLSVRHYILYRPSNVVQCRKILFTWNIILICILILSKYAHANVLKSDQIMVINIPVANLEEHL
jgi:hypothetical protein